MDFAEDKNSSDLFLYTDIDGDLPDFISLWISGKRVAMTDMPQMVALYNGMGGGSAAAIGAVELLRFSAEGPPASRATVVLCVAGALIGSISLPVRSSPGPSSMVEWTGVSHSRDSNGSTPLVFLVAVGLGIASVMLLQQPAIIGFFVAALAFGVLMTLPIGGADMPVVISLFNALTGLAVAFEGYVLGIEALIIAGMVVGAAGTC